MRKWQSFQQQPKKWINCINMRFMTRESKWSINIGNDVLIVIIKNKQTETRRYHFHLSDWQKQGLLYSVLARI